MKKKITAFAVCLTAILTISCSKQNLKTAWATQEERIDSFIASLSTEGDPNDPDAIYAHEVVYNGGSSRVVMRAGTGDALVNGGTVSFYYTGYVFTGNMSASNIFATNNQATAQANGWEVTDADYSIKTVTLGSDDGLLTGLHNGLVGVRAGEICYILFSGQYGFGKRQVEAVPANSALLYEIQVESVTN